MNMDDNEESFFYQYAIRSRSIYIGEFGTSGDQISELLCIAGIGVPLLLRLPVFPFSAHPNLD